LPVAYWGVFGYVIFLLFLLAARTPGKHPFTFWSVLLLLAMVFSGAALYFGYISTSKIGSYCILCIANYAISFALLIYCFITYRRFSNKKYFTDLGQSLKYSISHKALVLPLISVLALIVVTWSATPQYWEFQMAQQEFANVELETGITDEGNPWIGNPEAEITIHVYSDYMCFQCAKTHHILRSLLEQKNQFKLVAHQYPLDHEFNPVVVKDPFHVGSGKMSLLALYGLTRNKFWEVNDALFEIAMSKQSFSTNLLAEKTGLTSGEFAWALEQPEFRKILEIEIRRGMKKRITSTPTFIIDGTKYSGHLPPAILSDIGLR
jgi:hypothetical protein